MTVQSTNIQTIANGNGIATTFAYQFKLSEAADLVVQLEDTNGVVHSPLVLNSDYTVDPLGLGLDDGGNITYNPSSGPLPSGWKIIMTRVLGITQDVDLANQGTYLPENVEGGLDSDVMMLQQHDFQIKRTIRGDITDSPMNVIPAAASRAGKYLAFDSTGEPITVALSPSAPVMQSVTSVAAMRLISGTTDGASVVLTGYTSDNDGGGAIFIWDAASVAADDGGLTTVKATAVSTGRWLRLSYLLQQTQTGHFFGEDGALINRLGDRVFIGAATASDGIFPQVNDDWLSTFYNANGYTGAVLEGNLAVLTTTDRNSAVGAIFGSRTLDFTSAMTSGIGVQAVSVNDNATLGTYGWGLYVEGHHMNTTVLGTYAAEFDIRNLGSSVVSDPYQQGIGHATAVQIAAGAGVSSTGQFNATAAISIRANPMAFNTGIVFGSDAIVGATGSSGTGIAIAFGLGHMMQWYNGTGATTGYILGNGTTHAGQTGITLSDYGVMYSGPNSGQDYFQITGMDNAVNYFRTYPAVAGSNPKLSAVGSDTNIGMVLEVKSASSVFLFEDSSGHAHFQVSPVASSSDYVNIISAASGSAPQVSTTGTSDLKLSPGSGYVEFATVANGAVATAMSNVGPTGSHTTIQEWLAIKNASGTVRYIPLF